MKIIGFNGSPRTEGNTAWAVNQILDGAKDGGAETEFWNVGNLNLSPCKGCLGCVQSGKCAINDDMQKIYGSLRGSQALVLGSPIYMGQMSAQAKAFTDRLFAHITPRFSPRFKEENAGKKLVIVFTQGNPDADMFKEYFDYTKKMFGMLEFEVVGLHAVSGLRTEKACDRESLCNEMRDAGRSLIIN